MKKFVTVAELHELTGLSVHTIRNRVQKGTYKTLARSSKNEKILIYYDSIFANEELKQTE